MITIIFDTDRNDVRLQSLIDLAQQLKVTFKVSEPLLITPEDAIIKERLRQKYVLSGQWDTMTLDEKEDAAMLESMLYDREIGVPVLTPNEQANFIKELRSLAENQA